MKRSGDILQLFIVTLPVAGVNDRHHGDVGNHHQRPRHKETAHQHREGLEPWIDPIHPDDPEAQHAGNRIGRTEEGIAEVLPICRR